MVEAEKRILIKAPVALNRIEEVDLAGIVSGFKSTRKGYSLPRIAFIGLFRFLSQSDQRHIAKNLGFEYYDGIHFGTTADEQIQILATKWPKIFSGYTRLIVLGDATVIGWDDGIPEMDRESGRHFFRAYKKSLLPIYAEYKIPVIMESELIKLHSEYPDINNNTIWRDEPKPMDTESQKQGSLLNFL